MIKCVYIQHLVLGTIIILTITITDLTGRVYLHPLIIQQLFIEGWLYASSVVGAGDVEGTKLEKSQSSWNLYSTRNQM